MYSILGLLIYTSVNIRYYLNRTRNRNFTTIILLFVEFTVKCYNVITHLTFVFSFFNKNDTFP